MRFSYIVVGLLMSSTLLVAEEIKLDTVTVAATKSILDAPTNLEMSPKDRLLESGELAKKYLKTKRIYYG